MLLEDPRKDLSRVVRDALAELTETQLRYVELYYIRQLLMRDVAAQCGVNVSTVSRTIARAKNRLGRSLRLDRNALLFSIDD